MKRTLTCTLVALSLVVACDPAEEDSDTGADTGSAEESGSDETGEPASCEDGEALPASIEEDTTVEGCVVLDQTVVRGGATLEFLPGTTVLALPGGFLEARRDSDGTGAIVATETTFTSWQDAPAPGDWGCIALEVGSTLQDVTIEYGGAPCGVDGLASVSALVIREPSGTVLDVTITDSAGHGLELRANAEGLAKGVVATFARNELSSVFMHQRALLELDTSVFEDPDDYIEVDATTQFMGLGGTVSPQPVPYRIVGSLGAGGGGSDPGELQFLAGTTIELTLGSNIEIRSGWGLRTSGTPDAPVVFTSAAGDPQPGDWGCIVSEFSEPFTLRDTVIEYAGAGEGCDGTDTETALMNVPGGSSIQTTTFRHVVGDGITGDYGDCDGAWCDNDFAGVSGVAVRCPGSEIETPC